MTTTTTLRTRCRWRDIVIMAATVPAFVGVTAACQSSTIGPGDPGVDAATEVCQLADMALASAESGNIGEALDLTAELLDTAQNLPADDVVLLYSVSYVGDAYRGSSPEQTVPYMLADLVNECAANY